MPESHTATITVNAHRQSVARFPLANALLVELLAVNGSRYQGGPRGAGYTIMHPPHMSCRKLHVAPSGDFLLTR